MPKSAKVTAVEWSWRDDKGNWIKYTDEKLINALEDGYQAKKSQVKVDDERYVDLAVSVKDMKDSFTFPSRKRMSVCVCVCVEKRKVRKEKREREW
jgi:hypothetical protein